RVLFRSGGEQTFGTLIVLDKMIPPLFHIVELGMGSQHFEGVFNPFFSRKIQLKILRHRKVDRPARNQMVKTIAQGLPFWGKRGQRKISRPGEFAGVVNEYGKRRLHSYRVESIQ